MAVGQPPPPILRSELSRQLGADLVFERQAADHPRLGPVPPLRGRVLFEQETLLSQELYLRRQGYRLRFTAPRSWLVLVLEGSLALDLGGRDAPLLLDSNVRNLCISRAVCQEVTVLQAPTRLLRIGLPPTLCWSPAEHCGQLDLPLLEPMLQLLQQAHKELAPEATRQRLLEALKSYCSNQLEPQGVCLQTSAEDPLHSLLNWLQLRLGDELHLADLAAAACLSARRLQELCQQRYACSPMELVRQLRLQALHDDLLNPAHGHEGLSKLYQRWQLADSGATRKAFEALYGQSPSSLRRRAGLAKIS